MGTRIWTSQTHILKGIGELRSTLIGARCSPGCLHLAFGCCESIPTGNRLPSILLIGLALSLQLFALRFSFEGFCNQDKTLHLPLRKMLTFRRSSGGCWAMASSFPLLCWLCRLSSRRRTSGSARLPIWQLDWY